MARALLAALLLERNRVVSLDRLETLLWDGRPPARARASLHNHLMRLRRSLGDHSRVRSEGGGLVVRAADGELDHLLLARRLEAARRARAALDWRGALREADAALTLWRGAPLAEFPALAHEAAAQVSAWQEAYLQALELRGEAALKLGRHGDQLPELLRLVEEFPTGRPSTPSSSGRFTGRAAGPRHWRSTTVCGARSSTTSASSRGPPSGSPTRTRSTTTRPTRPGRRPRSPTPCPGTWRPSPGEAASASVSSRPPGTSRAAAGSWASTRSTACPASARPRSPCTSRTGSRKRSPTARSICPCTPTRPEPRPWSPRTPSRTCCSPWARARRTSPPTLRARRPVAQPPLRAPRARPPRRRPQQRPGGAAAARHPGSLVLITSRHRLEALADSTPVTLRVLSEEEAARLLVAKAARADITVDDPAVPALAALCGFLPLALQLIAARLRHRPAWTPADVVRDLRAAHGRLDSLVTEGTSVTAAFELSYQDLAPPARVLFRRLGLLLGDDVDAHAAAPSPACRSPGPARCWRNWRTATSWRSRRAGATGCTTWSASTPVPWPPPTPPPNRRPPSSASSVTAWTPRPRRTATWPGTANPRRHSRGGPPRPAGLRRRGGAMAWLRAERANLRAAVEYAARHGHPTHAIRISVAMTEFHRRSGHWLEALTLLRIALDAALATDDVAGQAMARRDTATLEVLQGKYERAEAGLLTALELFRSVGDRRQEAATLHNLARIQCLTGRFGEAEGILRQALDRFVDVDDRRGQAVIWIDMGQLQQLGGHCDEAIAHLEKALELLGTWTSSRAPMP
ncbi:tetratricopeptide repeat protein [Streptomyces diastatochromogenes]|nr:tetratricopeptide repeat protein [Streptomyces diastatochromogenes]